MPIDGIMLHALRDEIASCAGARLDRVTQPERDEVVLYFYAQGENRRLLLSASSSLPRVQWVGYPKENPTFAPTFCMLLRKHLTGARLLDATQPGLERVLDLKFECKNDFSENVEKHLIAEIMGRGSNLILTDGEGKIYDALRQADLTSGSVRKLIPGLKYELPPSQGKRNFLIDPEFPLPTETVRIDRFLTDTFEGFSPLLSREIAFRTFGTCDAVVDPAESDRWDRLRKTLARLREKTENGAYGPCVLRSDLPKDFYCFPVTQYGDGMTVFSYPTCSAALDAFYSEKDAADHIRRHSADISKFLSNTVARLSRKIESQRAELADSAKADLYKTYGDLILANLYRFNGREREILLPDYTCDPPAEIKVPLDPSRSASRNAQAYFKKYKKAQTAKTVLKEQIALAEKELEYLDSVRDSLTRASGLAELTDLRQELTEQGYLHRPPVGNKPGKRPGKQREQSRPLRYTVSDGFTVYCGRNNLQNDALTLHTADRKDWWFHVKDHPGSHVILVSDGAVPTDRAMTAAAVIAATNSSVSASENVAVDYTEVRYVHKPAGAKPGMVIYDTYRTAYVDPDADAVAGWRK